MFTLYLNCAMPNALVALFEGPQIAAIKAVPRHQQDPRGFMLQQAIVDLLTEQQVTWSKVTCVAAGIGPGPLTGLRVNIAVAQGIGLAQHIPGVGLPQWFGQVDLHMGATMQEIACDLGRQGFAVAEVVCGQHLWEWKNPTMQSNYNKPQQPFKLESIALASTKVSRQPVHTLRPIYLQQPDVRPQYDAQGRSLAAIAVEPL